MRGRDGGGGWGVGWGVGDRGPMRYIKIMPMKER